MLISFDPGLRMAGVALWTHEGLLLAAGLIRGSKDLKDAHAWWAMSRAIKDWAELQTWKLNTPPVSRWVSEFPKVYAAGKSKGDPEDLLQLASVVGGLAATWGPGTVLRPYEWKRQVPKDVMTERIKAKLSEDERAAVVLPAASYQHNVWDAVGIGLAHLGRLR